MHQLEADVRSDERSKVLDTVEGILFNMLVGPSQTLDETSDEETRRRVTVGMERFMRASKRFKEIFKEDWPNR